MTAVGDALGAIDRLVHLASYESFGLALAEAMAAGLPVVSTPVGFLAEYNQAARLVPLDADGREIAAIILRDLADADGAARRAEWARRLVAERFDRATYRRDWESLLAGTARRGPSAGAPGRPRGARVKNSLLTPAIAARHLLLARRGKVGPPASPLLPESASPSARSRDRSRRSGARRSLARRFGPSPLGL